MRKAFMFVLLAATAASPVAAQSGERGDWRTQRQAQRAERQEQRSQNQDAQPQQSPEQRAARQAQRAGRQTQRAERQVQRAERQVQRQQTQTERSVWQPRQAPVERADVQVAQPRPTRDWQRAQRTQQQPSQAGPTRGGIFRGREAGERFRQDRQDRRGDRQESRQDRREDRQDWRRDRRDDRQDWRQDRRDDRRDWRSDRRGNRDSWNRDWRRDNRYDWQGWRHSNRSIFRGSGYYAPYRNHRYSRLSIGLFLGSSFYANRYWLSDPWQYRLPPAPYGTQWVRYYDDVLLIDVYTGEVVDVIHDFFW